MKSIHLIITLLTLFSTQAQRNHIVIDSITKEPISFVAVKFGENSGLYTNEKGMFSLNDKAKDSIHISCLGYFDYKEVISKLNDTIYLIPKTEILNEIIITERKNKLLEIGSLKNSKNFSALIAPNTELVTFIKTKKSFQNSYLETIHIPVEKYFQLKQKNNQFSNIFGAFRINVYSVENELPKHKIYSSKAKKFNMNEKEIITVDVSDQILAFNEEGLCIGIELLGYVDENGSFDEDNKNSSYLRIPFTNKLTNNFETKTYYKYIFNDEDILIPYNDILKKSGINKELNIKIGLTISQ